MKIFSYLFSSFGQIHRYYSIGALSLDIFLKTHFASNRHANCRLQLFPKIGDTYVM